MKSLLTSLILFASLTFGVASCDKGNSPVAISENGNSNVTITNPTGSKMKITIGSAVFTATLYDNPSVTAFKTRLPLTINMEDLNANEKFYYFSSNLPISAAVGGNIQVGDLMLYGNNCLVLFYKGFNTSYSYTRLGKIDDVAGLVTALSSGNSTVKFENN
jgi:hypothetical protein